jgi:hypothetical protein
MRIWMKLVSPYHYVERNLARVKKFYCFVDVLYKQFPFRL